MRKIEFPREESRKKGKKFQISLFNAFFLGESILLKEFHLDMTVICTPYVTPVALHHNEIELF